MNGFFITPLLIMKNAFFIYAILITFNNLSAKEHFPNWGKTGHRTVGAIAENYLSCKTKKKIAKLLNGESLAYGSIYADEIRSNPKYNEFAPWHYVNFDSGKKYGETPVNPKGDIIQGIKTCILKIRKSETSIADKQFYLKFLVHLIGDLHQPLHLGNAVDKGGNTIDVEWFNTPSNLHRVWDSEMIDSYKMSYSELADNTKMLSKTELITIQSGSLLDWVYESKGLADKVYASAKKEDHLKYKYMYDFFPVVEKRLHKSGIRLAYLLEHVFSKKTAWLESFFKGI